MITQEQRDRLLDTLARPRRGKETADRRIAAIVLLALDGVRPAHALAWSVDDVVRDAPNRPGHWQIKPAVPVRGIRFVLPIVTRAALTVYLQSVINDGAVRRLDSTPIFGVSKRALQFAWTRLRARAKIGNVTFQDLHACSPAPKRNRRKLRLVTPLTAPSDDSASVDTVTSTSQHRRGDRTNRDHT